MHKIEDEICAGAWRCLCVNVLFQAVHNMSCERKVYRPGSSYRSESSGGLNKTGLNARAIARDWVEGGQGTVTFEDCCDSLGVDPDRAREKIKQYCQRSKSRARV